MEDQFFKISFAKVMELVLQEERQKIRNHFLNILGKSTADQMDSYEITESNILKLFTQ